VVVVTESMTKGGRAFQTHSATTEKAESPIVDLCDGGTASVNIDAERRGILSSVSTTRRSTLITKYDGAD